METNQKPNLLSDLFVALGKDDPSDIFTKPDEINVEEVAKGIIAHQRALASNDAEFISPYIEQGRQEVSGMYYKTLAQHFDVRESDLMNKPVDEIAKIIKAKATAGMSQTQKNYEDSLTEIKKERDSLQLQMNALIQKHENEKIAGELSNAIKLAVSKMTLATGVKSAETHVINELMNSGDFNITKDGSTYIVTNNKGQRFRPAGSTKPQPLTFEETIQWLLEQENMLKKQPDQNKANEQRQNQSFGINNTVPDQRQQTVSPEVMANHQRLQQKYGGRN